MYACTCDLIALSLLNMAHKTCNKGENIRNFACTQVKSYNQALTTTTKKANKHSLCHVLVLEIQQDEKVHIIRYQNSILRRFSN